MRCAGAANSECCEWSAFVDELVKFSSKESGSSCEDEDDMSFSSEDTSDCDIDWFSSISGVAKKCL